jgi:erythromycin esterase
MTSILKYTTKWILITVYVLGSCAGPQKTAPAVSSQEINFYPLRSVDDLDILLNEMRNARIVLLGEASHGTAEYYNWRAAISKRLIAEKGFNLIAVEGDYIDLYRLDQCVKGESQDTSIKHVLSGFNRWPQWLWCNEEFADFAQWIKDWNTNPLDQRKVTLCGLDVFNFAGALDHMVTILSDSAALYHTTKMQECIRPFGGDALQYSAAVSKGAAACNAHPYKLWQAVQKIAREKIDNAKELLLVQHALVVRNGEQYFRLRNSDAAESWNTRVRHMQELIRTLLQFYGREAKLIVWAHNTHIGDARYTDMPTRRRTNIGELLRKEYGEKKVFSAGFGSYWGEIIAGETWGAPHSKIKISPAKGGSWEELLHRERPQNKIILSKDLKNNEHLKTWVEQRAIGVVYRETYIPSLIPMRYDAFIYFDTTHAVHLAGR